MFIWEKKTALTKFGLLVTLNLVPRARVPFGQHRETRGSGRNDFLVREQRTGSLNAHAQAAV
jgi:hypothetical protein